MIAGFTGTRHGMNEEQKVYLEEALLHLGVTELHHGCCIGGDEQANIIARSLLIKTEGHPPINMRQMAHCTVDYMHPPAEYLERNHDIVDACGILFVAPRTNKEEVRSGTWTTFRYAKHCGTDVIMLKR